MHTNIRVALISIIDNKAVIVKQSDCENPNNLIKTIDSLFLEFQNTEYEYDIWEHSEEPNEKEVFEHLKNNPKEYARIDTWGFKVLADLYIYNPKNEFEMLENFNLSIKGI